MYDRLDSFPPVMVLRDRMNGSATQSATCLGCGCLCDDIEIIVERGSISRTVNTCRLGQQWFGDGVLPAEIRVGGEPASFDQALDVAAASLFESPGRLLIYIADDLSCEAHREAVSLADRLGASIDGIASDTVANGLLAAQRRGRASGTLGELRHRADAVVFWGVDPQERYPRFIERFIAASSLFAPERQLIAVDVGDQCGPEDCKHRISLPAADEIDAIGTMRAVIEGRLREEVSPPMADAANLAIQLASARYATVIFDAEPNNAPRDADLPEALIAFVQALNGPTRAALWGLRSGGNRNGFESVLTWQTGYPFAVDFAFGSPRYAAAESVSERLARGRLFAALVLGDPASVPSSVADQLRSVTTVTIGPRASEAGFVPAVAIDTGAASLHEDGLVLRMDDVPIHARKVLEHPRSAVEVLQRLSERLPATRREEIT